MILATSFGCCSNNVHRKNVFELPPRVTDSCVFALIRRRRRFEWNHYQLSAIKIKGDRSTCHRLRVSRYQQHLCCDDGWRDTFYKYCHLNSLVVDCYQFLLQATATRKQYQVLYSNVRPSKVNWMAGRRSHLHLVDIDLIGTQIYNSAENSNDRCCFCATVAAA